MLKIKVSPRALEQLNEIFQNVAEFTGYEASAVKLFDAIYSKFELLAEFPFMGRERSDGARETFERRYRIVYRIKNDLLEIVTVIHSSRLYPRPVDENN